jgi:glyoxylase-like metal-dependent hydrolase (beta-lactamase superfamily II)
MRLAKLCMNAALVVGVFAVGAYPQRQQQRAEAPLKVTSLNGGVYWTSGGAGANTGFIVGTTGVIVIDAKMTADSAKAMFQEISKVTPKTVTHIILTHSDADHANGMAGFPKGLVIVAHENCKNELKETLDGLGAAAPPAWAALRDYLPTQSITKNEDLTIDGVRLRLLHFGPGHTGGDLIVYLPDQKIAFAGDLLPAPGRFPLIHGEKHGSSDGWVANVKGLAALHATTYIPGHGDPQTQPVVQKSVSDAEARRNQVVKLFSEGRSLTQVREAIHDTAEPQFATAPTFTQLVYREASARQKFDPHDLNGFWQAHGSPLPTNERHDISLNPPPMTSWAQAKYDAAKPGLNGTGPGRPQPLGNDPIMICDPVGYPRVLAASGNYGIQIVQAPKETLMIFDWFYGRRDVYTDGRKLEEDPDPRFYGNSAGHWEGDTFVVESNGFDPRTWLDSNGHPHSDDMKLMERYRRVDHDTIELTMTLTDPKAYTQPWVSEKKYLEWFPSDELEARGSGWNDLREDLCIPSEEAKYKELVREPAGGNRPTK